MRFFARHDGIVLDPVYTGKAAAGMIAHIRAGRYSPGDVVAFVHIGGTPAIFTRSCSKTGGGRWRDCRGTTSAGVGDAMRDPKPARKFNQKRSRSPVADQLTSRDTLARAQPRISRAEHA